MIIRWKFTVAFNSSSKFGPNSLGIVASSPEDVSFFSRESGIPFVGLGDNRSLKVDELEGAPRLRKLLDAIESKYGFIPSSRKIVPIDRRDYVFGVEKIREYDEKDLELADLLHISHVKDIIGKYLRGTDEDVEEERYLVAENSRKRDVPFGLLSPFLAIAVSGEFKANIEQKGLLGVEFEPVIHGKEIWKLSSSLIMPRCLTPLVNGQGESVEPNQWNGKWSDIFFDDGGYEPPELCYRYDDLKRMGRFDLAVTAERTGGYKPMAFRRLVVSQRFRRVLDSMEIYGIRYTPVRTD